MADAISKMEIVGISMLNIYDRKKVFITGHSGFKGTWLLKTLEILGAEVMGYSLPPVTDPNHLSLIKVNAREVYGNILDFDLLKETISSFQPDVVFHLAAQPLVRKSYLDPRGTYMTNVIGTLNVLNACRGVDSIRTIVSITTDKVYENLEWTYPYRETDRLGGYDMYSSSKACCELLVSSFRQSFFSQSLYKKDHQVLLATARAGNVIGGGDWSEDRLIPDVVKAAANNSFVTIRNIDSVRPWQHVFDCVYGYLLLGEKLLKGSPEFATAWNFAPYSFESITVGKVIEIAKTCWDAIDYHYSPDPNGFHEAGILRLDNSKATSDLKWAPVMNTQAAITNTIKWYKDYYELNLIRTEDQIKSFLTNINS